MLGHQKKKGGWGNPPNAQAETRNSETGVGRATQGRGLGSLTGAGRPRAGGKIESEIKKLREGKKWRIFRLSDEKNRGC